MEIVGYRVDEMLTRMGNRLDGQGRLGRVRDLKNEGADIT